MTFHALLRPNRNGQRRLHGGLPGVRRAVHLDSAGGPRHAVAYPSLVDHYRAPTARLVAACVVDASYDQPWLANRSADGRVVYRDRRVPRVLRCGIDTDKTLPVHELSEWLAMNDGLPYDRDSAVKDAFDPNELRDPHGEWTSGGGSSAEISAKVSELQPKAVADLSVAERRSLSRYTDVHYKEINSYVRGSKMLSFGHATRQRAETDARNIDSVMARAKLPQAMTVYRGMRPGLFAELKPGDEFTDKGFVSVSANPKIAKHFGHGSALIKLPAGAKVIPIGDKSQVSKEAELLINRGSRFKVLEHTGKHITLELRP